MSFGEPELVDSPHLSALKTSDVGQGSTRQHAVDNGLRYARRHREVWFEGITTEPRHGCDLDGPLWNMQLSGVTARGSLGPVNTISFALGRRDGVVAKAHRCRTCDPWPDLSPFTPALEGEALRSNKSGAV